MSRGWEGLDPAVFPSPSCMADCSSMLRMLMHDCLMIAKVERAEKNR